MSDIVRFPESDRAHFRRLAKQRNALLRAFDRIESLELRDKAIETCTLLGISERNAPEPLEERLEE